MIVQIQVIVHSNEDDWHTAGEAEVEITAEPEVLAVLNWETICVGLVKKALTDAATAEDEATDATN